MLSLVCAVNTFAVWYARVDWCDALPSREPKRADGLFLFRCMDSKFRRCFSINRTSALLASIDYPEHLAVAGVAVEVNAFPIPMIVEVAALNGTTRKVRVKQPDAFTACSANAGIHSAVRSTAP